MCLGDANHLVHISRGPARVQQGVPDRSSRPWEIKGAGGTPSPFHHPGDSGRLAMGRHCTNHECQAGHQRVSAPPPAAFGVSKATAVVGARDVMIVP